ncbi:meiosis protein MEI2 [Penicillium pulvis]|uniref:meiosis protein MEI2 n=1 Tax=Penicillium pulvis TaxID=1562058 RepID=UPI0025468C1F|nr:meiosis protein MEI2 [Penicillium pulvis]KAJ5806131.1 meiosis protein MEI2 [Penicillium pulvis]
MSADPAPLRGSSSSAQSGSLRSPGTQLATFGSSFTDSESNNLPMVLSRLDRMDCGTPGPYPEHSYSGNGFNQLAFPRQTKQDDFDMLQDFPAGTHYESQAFGPIPANSAATNFLSRQVNPLQRQDPLYPDLTAPLYLDAHSANPDPLVHHTQTRYSGSVLPDQATDYLAYPNHPFTVTVTPQSRNDMRNFHAANPSPGFGSNLVSSGNSASPTRWPTPSMQNVFRGNRSTYPGALAQVPSMPRVPSLKDMRPYDRRFIVKNVDTNTPAIYILNYCHHEEFQTIFGPTLHDVRNRGQFWIGFSDMRQSQRAINHIAHDHPDWLIEPVGEGHFKHHAKIGPTHSIFEDQVLVIVYCGPGRTVPLPNLVPTLKGVLELVGPVADIRAVNLESPTEAPRFSMHGFVVRYYDTLHAANATRAINTIATSHFIIEVLVYHRDMEHQKIRHWTCQEQGRDGRVGHHLNNDYYLSPDDNRERSPRTPGRQVDNDEQVISPQRIAQGKDPRCTVMLKNIPNAQTWDQLKAYLDVTSAGAFDFLYLRMDFEQRLNVGYAFINFASPLDILPFFTRRNGTQWPGFNEGRPKVAEISYATTQSYTLLVEKFRNSPVMLDFPDNRPKLFYIGGPHAGEEAPFPPVNNFWTLAKGVERSKQTGLYKGGPRPMPGDRRRSDNFQPETALDTPIRSNRRRGRERERTKWGFLDSPRYRHD